MAVIIAACGDGSGADVSADALRGVWVGEVQPPAADVSALCIAILEAAANGPAVNLGGEVYLDGEQQGLIGGLMDGEGRFSLAGSQIVGIYSGALEGDTMAGTWATTGADIAPELALWSAERTDRESCA
jgi:hypothetical protein